MTSTGALPRRNAFALFAAALGRAVVQLREPAMLGILVRSLLISLAVFIGLAAVVWWALASWGAFEGALGLTVDVLGWTAFLALTWLLFPAVVSLAVTLYLDDAAEAIERRHYPADVPGRSQPFWDSFVIGLRFTALLVAVNLVALPIYIAALFIPFVGIFIFYAINGYFLSREYFELVAMRHMSVPEAYELRRRHGTTLFTLGAGFAFLLTVPLVNIVAPLLAVATMLHVFKALRANNAGDNKRGRTAVG